MRPSLSLSFALVFAALSGCAEPDPVASSSPAPGAPMADPGAAPAPDAGAPPAAGADGLAPLPAAPPTPPPGFASLIKDGKSVTLTGTLSGAKKAQVDFVAVGERDGQKAPEVLEVIQVTDGTFTVKAPATYDRPIYAVAAVVTNDAPSATDPGGMAGPLELKGKDLTVEIKVGSSADWRTSLPWYRDPALDAGPPPGGAPSAPVGGAAAPPVDGPVAAPGAPPPGAVLGGGPAAAPPAGAPPAGAPPATP